MAASFEDVLGGLCWVAYSPTNWDPGPPAREPSIDSIREDLRALYEAGFRGLVTYGSDGVLGAELPRLAAEEGFEGLILGLWSVPLAPAEAQAAQAAASSPIVVGYVVGNEGLGERYDRPALAAAIDTVRTLTGKPTTTTEQLEDYPSPPGQGVADLGDWLFPNVHPVFHERTDPRDAAAWTAWQYQYLKDGHPGRALLIKEVGLPSDGDPRFSEASQAQYYQLLSQTPTEFVFFESFDQPWKRHLPIEPYWGIFRQDRSPKPVAASVCR